VKLTGPSDEQNGRTPITSAPEWRLAIPNGTIIGTYNTKKEAIADADNHIRSRASFANHMILLPPGQTTGTSLVS
jgi:hypothetical protein